MACESEQDDGGTGLRWLRRAWLGAVERSQVQRLCRELLALYAEVSSAHPDLRGEPLYQQIVVKFTHSDLQQAKTHLNQAEASFAQWPSVRDLAFRDVVLYFVVSKSLTSVDRAVDSRVDLRDLVNGQIPAEL